MIYIYIYMICIHILHHITFPPGFTASQAHIGWPFHWACHGCPEFQHRGCLPRNLSSGSPFFEVLKLSICLCSTPIFLRAWWRLRLWGSPWSVNSASEFCLLGHDRATPSPPGGDKAAMASAHMQCTCSWFWLSKTGIINWPPWTGYWNVNISWNAILCYFKSWNILKFSGFAPNKRCLLRWALASSRHHLEAQSRQVSVQEDGCQAVTGSFDRGDEPQRNGHFKWHDIYIYIIYLCLRSFMFQHVPVELRTVKSQNIKKPTKETNNITNPCSQARRALLEPMRLCILGCKTGHFWKHDETCSLCSCQFGLSRCWFWMILGATDWNTWRDSEPALLKVVCCVIRHTNHTNKKVQKII